MSSRASRSDTQADITLRECLKKRQSFLMIAGAGSGKTTSLIKALSHIGEEYGEELRSNGQRVACITYTNVAVEEILSDMGEDTLYHISTIHSFLWEVIKNFHLNIRIWLKNKIEQDNVDLIEENNNPRKHKITINKNTKQIEINKKILEKIDDIKVFRYEASQRYSQGILSHSDIIKMVPQLIQEYPLLRKIIAYNFPFIFVDESQDTFENFVHALKDIGRGSSNKFCLGFFGDPMQKIYSNGKGNIQIEKGWKKIEKEENFRSPIAVLNVINRIRHGVDGLQQTGGLTENIGNEKRLVHGSARLFIVPDDEQKEKNLGDIREWLANTENDPSWREKNFEAKVKLLVLVHRMAAKQLGFLDLFIACHDTGPDNYKSGFNEGTLWFIRPFREILLPLIEAFQGNKKYEVMRLLIQNKDKNENNIVSPLFKKDTLYTIKENIASYLSDINENIKILTNMILSTENVTHTVGDCLKFAHKKKLIELDDRMEAALNDTLTVASLMNKSDNLMENSAEGEEVVDDEDEFQKAEKKLNAIQAYLKCSVSQINPYLQYLDKESPYSTQHGVKGAEFKRVMVILDDKEAKYNQYSFDQLFKLKPLNISKNNQDENKETVIDRTRRLFYVCCSRAQKHLAVVLFTNDTNNAKNIILAQESIFESNSILTLEDIKTVKT
ncbi:MAG: AAA family ATPase [Magnetococcus sp. DMHC-6]